MLGSLEGDVQNWVKKSPAEWGVINLRTVMAAAEAIVAKYDRKKLPRHGEHIKITKHYAKSLLRKMGLVKRHKSREKFAKIF